MTEDKVNEQQKSEKLDEQEAPQNEATKKSQQENSNEKQKENSNEKSQKENKKKVEMVEIPKEEYEKLLNAKKIADEEVKRARADSLNFRKRIEKEKADFIEYAASSVLSKLLVVSDDLQRLLETSKEHIPKEHFEGIKNINLRINSIFEGEGVALLKIKKKKTAFDPKYHEAVVAVPTDDVKPNVIIDIISNGFVKNDRVLRPARVVISKEIPKEVPKEEEQPQNAQNVAETENSTEQQAEKVTEQQTNEKVASSEEAAKN